MLTTMEKIISSVPKAAVGEIVRVIREVEVTAQQDILRSMSRKTLAAFINLMETELASRREKSGIK